MEMQEQLALFGFAISNNVVKPSLCDDLGRELDNIEQKKRNEGRVFESRSQVLVYSLVAENPDTFLPLIDYEPVYSVVEKVLSSGEQIILNCLDGSRSMKVEDYRSNDDTWKAHIDHRMPTPDFPHTASVLAMICLDDFDEENGALRVWPLSHRSGMRPPKEIETSGLPGSIQCTAPRGSVIYWLGQTWHAIGRNVSGQRRWGIISHYTYWWVKPMFDFTYCGADIYRRLTARQKALLGFSSRPPISPDIGIHTVTNPADLPDDYELAMRPDYRIVGRQDNPQ